MVRTSASDNLFWDKVLKNDKCWNWAGYVDALGYGRLGRGKGQWKAHRYSWFLKYGRLSRTIKVLHTCDNRRCVNPNHLFLGTQADNVRDMVQKGRNRSVGARREINGQAKLTSAKVLEIRKRYKPGNGYQLAREFGVSRMTITRAVTGECWRHL